MSILSFLLFPLPSNTFHSRDSCTSIIFARVTVEKHYGRLVLQPFLEVTLTSEEIDKGGATGSCNGLSLIYDATIAYIEAACGEILRTCEAVFHQDEEMIAKDAEDMSSSLGCLRPCGYDGKCSHTIDLLCNGLWAYLQHSLVTKLGDALFSTGIAETMHANYTATERFLDQLAAIAVPMALREPKQMPSFQQRHFRSISSDRMVLRIARQIRRRLSVHSATQEIWHRWNLQIYFQLRQAQIIQYFDKAVMGALIHNSQLPSLCKNKDNNVSTIDKISSMGSNSSSLLLRLSSVYDDSSDQLGRSLFYIHKEQLHRKQPSPDMSLSEEVNISPVDSITSSVLWGKIRIRIIPALEAFNLPMMQSIHDAVIGCFHPALYLPSLGPRILKLGLQLLTKFTAWLHTALEGRELQAMVAQPRSNCVAEWSTKYDLSNSVPLGGESNDMEHSAAIMNDGSKKNDGELLSFAHISTEDLVVVACDAERLACWLRNDMVVFEKGECSAELSLTSPISSLGVDGVEGIKSSCLQSAAREATESGVQLGFERASVSIDRFVVTAWLHICNEILNIICGTGKGTEGDILASKVKGIISTYRMTNKPTPTAPSPFMKDILAPVRELESHWRNYASIQSSRVVRGDILTSLYLEVEIVDEGEGGRKQNRDVSFLTGEKDWKFFILSSLVDRYRDVVLELLSTVQQMEKSLKKRGKIVKKNMGSLSSNDISSASMSDAQKIGVQLLLDTKELGAELEKDGMKTDSMENYQGLLTALLPFQHTSTARLS